MNFSQFKVKAVLFRIVILGLFFTTTFSCATEKYTWCPKLGEDCIESHEKKEMDLYMKSWFKKERANFLSIGFDEDEVVSGVVEYFKESAMARFCVVFLGEEKGIMSPTNNVGGEKKCEAESNLGYLWVNSIHGTEDENILKVHVNSLGSQGVFLLDMSKGVRVLDVKAAVKESVQ